MLEKIWYEELRKILFVNIFRVVLKKHNQKSNVNWISVFFTKDKENILTPEKFKKRMKMLNYWIIWEKIAFNFKINDYVFLNDYFLIIQSIYKKKIEFIFQKLFQFNKNINNEISEKLYNSWKWNNFIKDIFIFSNWQHNWHIINILRSFELNKQEQIKKIKKSIEVLKNRKIEFFLNDLYSLKFFDRMWIKYFLKIYFSWIMNQLSDQVEIIQHKKNDIDRTKIKLNNTFRIQEIQLISDYINSFIDFYDEIYYQFDKGIKLDSYKTYINYDLKILDQEYEKLKIKIKNMSNNNKN